MNGARHLVVTVISGAFRRHAAEPFALWLFGRRLFVEAGFAVVFVLRGAHDLLAALDAQAVVAHRRPEIDEGVAEPERRANGGTERNTSCTAAQPPKLDQAGMASVDAVIVWERSRCGRSHRRATYR